MLTFQNLYEEAQTQAEDTSADSLVLIKRAINQGAKQFGAILNREWRNTQKTFNLVADQQFYQTPEDCIRVKSVTGIIAGIQYVLTEIPDEDTWNRLNDTGSSSSQPSHYFIRGNDEFGIYPTPAENVTNGGRLNYERRMRDMSAADYTTGTVTTTLNSATLTGSGTTFTAAMVGRSFKVADPNGDGMWYKIAAYVDATTLTLENTYAGATAASLTYSIGELPDIPEEFHESLVDYALFRYYRMRRDLRTAQEMRATFIEALSACQFNYSSKTTSQYFRPVRLGPGYTHGRKDYTVT